MNVIKSIFATLTALVLISFNACSTTPKSEDGKMNLVGKVLEYDYGVAGYRVEFISNETLHWKSIKGEEKGRESDETYTMQKLGEGIFFISWIEEDGLGVSLVLNLKEKKVNAFLKIEAEIVPLNGTVTIVK